MENGHRPGPAKPFDLAAAREIAVSLRAMDGALMPILHTLLAEFGYLDPAVEPMLGEVLNITRAEVHGVVTFYKDFRRAPAGRHHLAMCRAEACQSMGCEALAERAEARLGIGSGETTPDGEVTLEAVYCLGLCSVAPSAVIDGRPVARLDAARLDALLSEIGQ